MDKCTKVIFPQCIELICEYNFCALLPVQSNRLHLQIQRPVGIRNVFPHAIVNLGSCTKEVNVRLGCKVFH